MNPFDDFLAAQPASPFDAVPPTPRATSLRHINSLGQLITDLASPRTTRVSVFADAQSPANKQQGLQRKESSSGLLGKSSSTESHEPSTTASDDEEQPRASSSVEFPVVRQMVRVLLARMDNSTLARVGDFDLTFPACVRLDVARVKSHGFALVLNRQVILTATKRTDGLKALSLTSNIVFTLPGSSRVLFKLKGSPKGCTYTLYDDGVNPKEPGAARNELAMIKTWNQLNTLTRRGYSLVMPAVASPDSIAERDALGDLSLMHFSSKVPGTLNDIPGFRDLAELEPASLVAKDSTKNMVLAANFEKVPRACLIAGKTRSGGLALAVDCNAVPLAVAFAMAIVAMDSKNHPRMQ